MEELTLKNGIDPRLEALSVAQNKMVFEIPQGSAYTNKVAQKANSVSNQSVSFNFNTQGKNVLIDRRFYCRMRFKVIGTFTAAAGADVGGYLSGFQAPRAFPIASCAENVSLSINGTTVSANYADMMSAYLRYTAPVELMAYDLSGTPSQLDFYSEYSTIPDTNTSPRSPFVPVEFSGGQSQLSRASFNLVSIDGREIPAGTTAARELIFEIVEPLMLSPLLYSSRNLESALLGVTNLAVNINFGDLSRVFSQNNARANPTSTYTASIEGIPELLIEYKNLQLVEEGKIPRLVRYNYQRPEVYVNDTNVILGASGNTTFTTQTINNNAIQLSTCPKRIYIYASKGRGIKTVNDADTFLPITSLSLSYLNVSGQFSAFSQNDLFNLSVKNGYAGSFQEWSGLAIGRYGTGDVVITSAGLRGRQGLSGSVLCIDSTDLALPSNIASGILVNSQLQFQVGLLNNTASPYPVTITTIVVNDGIMEIADGGMTTRIGVISSEDVLRVRSGGEASSLVHHTQLEGGGIFDFMRKVVSAVPAVIQGVGDVVDVGKDVFETGKKVVDTGRSILGKGVHTGGALVAGAMTGGRAMSKAELRRLLG